MDAGNPAHWRPDAGAGYTEYKAGQANRRPADGGYDELYHRTFLPVYSQPAYQSPGRYATEAGQHLSVVAVAGRAAGGSICRLYYLDQSKAGSGAYFCAGRKRANIRFHGD